MMRVNERSAWAAAGFGALAAAGFLLPFWPFAAAGVALAGATGRVALALALGLLLDLVWGAPGGALGFVQFPLTLLGLLCFGLRKVGERYVFPRSAPRALY